MYQKPLPLSWTHIQRIMRVVDPKARAGRIIRPGAITAERPEEEVRLVFGYEHLEEGEYTFRAVNPGGLTADLGTFRIAYKKPVDFNVSAGYRPMIGFPEVP